MKNEIVRYIKGVCEKYGFSAFYYPESDIYCVHYKGRAIQNFNSMQFRELPPQARNPMWLPLMKVGLNNNLAESAKNQIFINRKHGITIVR